MQGFIGRGRLGISLDAQVSQHYSTVYVQSAKAFLTPNEEADDHDIIS